MMNPYLSREEKERFIRVTALASMLDDTVDGYAGVKSTDPAFLKALRMGRTMLQKALTIRASALEQSARDEFYKQISKLEFIWVPTAEAKKHLDEIVALKTTLPMELQDFEDWYCAVIETTCKTCLKTDYTECQIRRVLMKYGVYPIDPGATNKCQYCYVGTPESDKPVGETEAETVPVNRYNLAVAEYDALATEVQFEYLPKIEELQRKIEQLESLPAAPAADPAQGEEVKDKGELIPVTLGLLSGNKLALDLPEDFTTHLIDEMHRPSRNSRPFCACHVGDELVAVDMQDIVTIQAAGMDYVEKPRTPQPFTPRPAGEYEDTGERERYRVECKCGAEYFCTMNVGRDWARCRECKSKVFADRQAEPVTDPADDAAATLLTNRYYVEKNDPSNSTYVDPCDPLRKGA